MRIIWRQNRWVILGEKRSVACLMEISSVKQPNWHKLAYFSLISTSQIQSCYWCEVLFQLFSKHGGLFHVHSSECCHLHQKGILIFPYIDNWFVAADPWWTFAALVHHNVGAGRGGPSGQNCWDTSLIHQTDPVCRSPPSLGCTRAFWPSLINRWLVLYCRREILLHLHFQLGLWVSCLPSED